MKVLMKWLMAMTLCGVASVSSAVGVIENSSAASESIAEAASGASLFQNNCLHCHNGSVPKAPHAISFNMMSTASIVTAISEGVMRQQAAHLSQEERVQIARYLSESVDTASEEVKACDNDFAPVLAENDLGWSGWGGGIRNQRFQDADSAGLGPDTVGEL